MTTPLTVVEDFAVTHWPRPENNSAHCFHSASFFLGASLYAQRQGDRAAAELLDWLSDVASERADIAPDKARAA